MANNYLTPPEIAEYTISGGYQKINRTFLNVLLMAIMAGIYIALGGLASSIAAHDVANKGIAKLVTGAVFPVGLMFVVINGADLFTGNSLIVMAVYEKKTTIVEFIKNLFIVLAGNFIGAVSISYLVANTNLPSMSHHGFGAYILLTAVSKINLSFKEALFLGIICNIFVCAGIWMGYSGKDVAGKVLASFFPIFAFAISGAEHVVANMYYIPTALLIKSNPVCSSAANLTTTQLQSLSWTNFFVKNVLPVTLGNIIGGVFIGTMYYLIYKKCVKQNECPN